MKNNQPSTKDLPVNPKSNQKAFIRNIDGLKHEMDSSDQHLAFDNSLQANIIHIIEDDKITSANRAACRLLGYTKKILLTKNWQDIFGTKGTIPKKAVKPLTDYIGAKSIVTAVKRNGEQFFAEITSAVFTDRNGVDKSITTIINRSEILLKQMDIDSKQEKMVADDITTALLKSDTRLAENNKWIKYIAKTSYDVMWDWDIITNEIYVGDSVEEVFGYKARNNHVDFADWSRCLHPGERTKVENRLNKVLRSAQKSWSDSFNFIRRDRSVANTTCRASIVRNEDGKAIRMIGAIQDVSRLLEMEEKLREQTDIREAEQKEHDEKYSLTAKVSFDVILDWNLVTGEVFIGDGFEEMFGYKIKNNKARITDWTRHIHPDDKEAMENKIREAIQSSVQAWEYACRFKRSNGSIALIVNRGSIIRDRDGKAIRMIGAIQDISQQMKLEKRLDHEIAINEKLLSVSSVKQLLFENTLQANIITDGQGNIIEVNSIALKMFGYNKKGIIAKGREGLFNNTDGELAKLVSERERKGNMNGELTGIKKNGKHFPCEVSSVLFKIDTGEQRAILIVTDISKRVRKQESIDMKKEKLVSDNIILAQSKSDNLLTENNERLQHRFNLSEEILWDLNIETNVVNVSDAYEKQFGHKITDNMTPALIWTSHVHPDDKEDLVKDLYRALESEDSKWEYNYRFLMADNSIVNVVSRCVIQRDENGKAFRVMGLMSDLGREKELEEKLKLEISLKEQQIAEAVLEAQELERSDIGKELHDNVNQLLGASSLYIDMAKEEGANREMYLRRSHEYTITAIEEIRKLSKGLVTDVIKDLGLGEAIHDMSKDMMEVHPVKITSTLNNFIENRVNNKFKLNVFRIIQEHLANIIKHANASLVQITFSQNKKVIMLSVSDDGCGFDTTRKSKGIGIANIKSRTELYKGSVELVSQPGKGCILTVKFPVTNELLNIG